MTLLNTYPTIQAAYIDKGFLESHGIDAVVQEDAMSQIFPGSATGGQISLYVPESQASEAENLLAHRE